MQSDLLLLLLLLLLCLGSRLGSVTRWHSPRLIEVETGHPPRH
jgi:hypothetical protein